MLREAVSSVDEYEFEIEDQLERQVGTIPLPFPKMDSELANDSAYATKTFTPRGTSRREQGCSVRVLPERRMLARQPLPVPSHARGEDGRVQALDASPLQEGRRLRVPTRVRDVQDAHLLLLPAVW